MISQLLSSMICWCVIKLAFNSIDTILTYKKSDEDGTTEQMNERKGEMESFRIVFYSGKCKIELIDLTQSKYISIPNSDIRMKVNPSDSQPNTHRQT